MPYSPGTQNQSGFLPAVTEPRQRGPLGERLTDSELEPIRVHAEGDAWLVDYGSYVQGHHGSREEAIGAAVTAAFRENRHLTIERPRTIRATALRTTTEPTTDVDA